MKLFYVVATVLVLGGTGYFSGWVIDLYLKTVWIPIVSCLLGVGFALLIHGVPDEEDEIGN